MVKGKKKILLTKEQILSKITSYDIYRYYHGHFKINELLVNHHRGETDPSLIIGNKVSSDLTHKDFGSSDWKGDCFHFVEQIHRCDFKMALNIINRDFNLGLNGEAVGEKKIITWEKPIIEMKKPPIIQVVTKKFEKRNWDYWGCYHQGEEDIKREQIYIPSQIWINKKKIFLGDLETYCYYFEKIDKWKIYRPFAEKRAKNTPRHLWKWDTNVPFDHIENLEAIQDAELAILGKSRKDRMVLMKALEIDSIANVQAEDAACMTKEVLDIFETAKRKVAVTDNDKKGKEFSWWLTNNYGYKHCNVPDKYLSTEPKLTDFADLSCVYDLDKVKQHFKNKRII